MAVDEQVQVLLDQMAAMEVPPFHTLAVDQARQMTEAMAAMGGEPEPVARIEDTVVPGPDGAIPVRIYGPDGPGPLPVLVYFHGGGWVIGSIASHDPVCRSLARRAGCVVVSVEYRLAPEHRFPAAPEDAFAALQWVAAHAGEIGGDPARLAVAGDSAGGNLAAVVSLMARDRGGPPLRMQVLVYPVTDHEFDSPSMVANAEGFLLTRDDMRWFWDLYLTGANDASDPYASPLRATDLSGLPPALVITAEMDPLRDQGEAYAAQLQAAGVPTTCRRYGGMVHGFFGMGGTVQRANEAVDEVAAALRGALEQDRAVSR